LEESQEDLLKRTPFGSFGGEPPAPTCGLRFHYPAAKMVQSLSFQLTQVSFRVQENPIEISSSAWKSLTNQ
jgi:hypothetical protein